MDLKEEKVLSKNVFSNIQSCHKQWNLSCLIATISQIFVDNYTHTLKIRTKQTSKGVIAGGST
jgi:hypothetical protein